MPVQDGKRYSPLDRQSVHADMAEDPIATRRNMEQQPAVARAHENCADCANLLPPQAPNRMGKIRLNLQQVSDMLGLPAGTRALRMFVDDDPHALFVVIEGDDLKPVPDGQELPDLHITTR
ncbi:hypothetical protein ABZY58_11680 [Micromonospora tulbaghiae]|uniref:hypothetical protein n=1 Tax=Micromonospora tulbaghiae TaxID=479978 RepID=UPI0033B13B03